MTRAPEFHLLPIRSLAVHEEIDPAKVDELVEEIRRTKVVREPIWVAADHHVILNGHHRFTALQRLGAVRVPAWVVAYDDPRVRLDRWGPGPPLSKEEVLARAKSERPFPPKTTKHSMPDGLPARPTPLETLLPRHRPRVRPAPHASPSRTASPDGGAS